MSRPAPSRPRFACLSELWPCAIRGTVEFRSLRNHQFLSGIDRVRILQDIPICIEDLRVLIGVTVELAPDFGKSISGFDRIVPLVFSSADGRPRDHGARSFLALQ